MFHKGAARQNLGFTLIEILIVIVVIGILASSALPRFLGQTEKAKTAEAINMISAIRHAQLHYYDVNDKVYKAIGKHCDPSTGIGLNNRDKFTSYFGVQLPPCSNDRRWEFETFNAEAPDPIVTAYRVKEGVLSEDDTISIDEEGKWSGTGDYAGPTSPTGKYWPF